MDCFSATTMCLNYKHWFVIFGCLLISHAVLAQQQSTSPKGINLDITTHLGDQQVFHAGDKLGFMLSLDEDAYLYLFYEDAENNLMQLLPSAQSEQHFFHAGLYIPVPDASAPFSFKVQAPFGNDQVWAFAMDRPALPLEGKQLANGLTLLSVTIEQVREAFNKQAIKIFDESSKKILTRPTP